MWNNEINVLKKNSFRSTVSMTEGYFAHAGQFDGFFTAVAIKLCIARINLSLRHLVFRAQVEEKYFFYRWTKATLTFIFLELMTNSFFNIPIFLCICEKVVHCSLQKHYLPVLLLSLGLGAETPKNAVYKVIMAKTTFIQVEIENFMASSSFLSTSRIWMFDAFS